MEAVIELQTKRLILREYTHADFDALYEILSDAETMKHYKEPYDSDGVHLWIEWNLESYKDFGFGSCGRFRSKGKTTKMILLSAIAE